VAKLLQTGYRDSAFLGNSVLGVPVTTAVVGIAAASAQSATLTAGRVYRLYASVNCFIKFATSPTATTSDYPLAAGVPEEFMVPVAGKLAVIRSSADSSLYISLRSDGTGS